MSRCPECTPGNEPRCPGCGAISHHPPSVDHSGDWWCLPCLNAAIKATR